MTLEKTLRQQLNKADSGGFHVSCDGWNINLVADQSDSLSCALVSLTAERANAIREELEPWAKRVVQRATGLLEPLALKELDGPLGKALLRSQAPLVRDGKSFYYELVLERTGRTLASLRRYCGDRQNGEKRETVPFVLTHDAIVKLVMDIVGSN